jgi:hypothetical protein
MSDMEVDMLVDVDEEAESTVCLTASETIGITTNETVGITAREQCVAESVESVIRPYISGLCLLCLGGISRSEDKLHAVISDGLEVVIIIESHCIEVSDSLKFDYVFRSPLHDYDLVRRGSTA